MDVSFSSFEGNDALHGGALYLAEFVELSASRCTFEGNIASAHGGAVFTEGKVTINESSFLGNIGVEGVSQHGQASHLIAKNQRCHTNTLLFHINHQGGRNKLR